MEKDILICVEQGILKGVRCKEYIAFKGIPYAQPPVGNLRFRAPEPPLKWQGVKDASSHGPMCPQYYERGGCMESGDEDCLYLNVYVPNLRHANRGHYPVMVWIHGGAYYTGNGNADVYGPKFLLRRDVIVVTLNYRLEVLGFLCLDTEEVPGNAGLKDQVMALQWVKDNIRVFGGDPDNVTLFGCSGGSACVSFHLISHMSQGLFNKAILQSGVCLNDWSYCLNGRSRAFQLAAKLGKATDDIKEVLTFLRNVPATSLIRIELPLRSTNFADRIFFGPVVEKRFPNLVPFLMESPIQSLIKKKFHKIPILMGYTSAEGIELARYCPLICKEINDPEMNVPRELTLQWPEKRTEAVSELVLQYYFKKEPVSQKTIQNLVDLETDLHFSYNIMRFADMMSADRPVYFYKFTCETNRNFMKAEYAMADVVGVCHADDLPYIFNISKLKETCGQNQCFIDTVVSLWTNFAKKGNPTPPESDLIEWIPYDAVDRHYMIIDKTLIPDTKPDHERYQFWQKIYGNICECPD